MITSRSLLFVPGHKESWIPKALNSDADAIIIDLEDAVPDESKQEAREIVRGALDKYGAEHNIVVRINALDTDHFGADIQSIAHPNLKAFLLPKIYDRDDMIRFDGVIRAAEISHNLPIGSLGVIPSFETAKSIRNVDSILTAPRVIGVMGAAAKNADISREVGFKWTTEGLETLHLRSKILLAAKSAGISLIVLGLWQDISDLDGLAKFAKQNSGIGYTGQVIIHPTHAEIVNREYSLNDQEIAYYRGLVEAFDQAHQAGSAAAIYEGEHIDIAHANHARELLSKYE